MKKIISTLIFTCFCLFVVFSCFGQSGQPSPTPTPTDDEVVRISTTLVQFDVTVTDKSGKIIKDLKPEDFEIYENGEKREVTSFKFVSPNSDASTPTENSTKIPLPNAPLKPEQVRRTVALVVDDLTLTWENINFVRKSLRKFVDQQMREGDLVAIARTGGSIGILEQFTSDKRLLYAAIEKIKFNPLGLGGANIDFADIKKQSFSDEKPQGLIQDPTLRDPDTEAKEFRQSAVAAGTINGLRYVVSGMKNLPGRKSMILFSEGFKLFRKTPAGKETDYRVHDALEKLFDTAARSSVVVNTIDARGLITEPDENLYDKKETDFYDQQDGLIYMAQQTGGVPIKDNNDFNLGVEKILNSQKNYYLIGYTPDGDTFDPKTHRFNKFVVKVKREGAVVQYRSGFFGVTNDETNENPANITASERLRNALVSPFAASAIALNLNALFGNDARQGAFVRSLLHINAKDLKFTDQAGGGKRAVFDVLALTFDDKGAQIDKTVKNYELTLPVKEYQRFLAEGFVYYFTLPVKKPGAYQLRVAIRDKQSDKIGSASQFIEVPNLKKDDLTLSGVVLESLTRKQWEKEAQDKLNVEKIADRSESNLLADTSLKHFKRDTILRYGFEIYNAKLDSSRRPELTAQINVFRDGNLVLEGKQQPVDLKGQTDWQKVSSFGAVVLGSEMPPGDYVLQITVIDNLAKGKDKISTQFVPFEIVE